MNTISILKIEVDNRVILTASDATQEVFPIFENDIKRNLDFVPFPLMKGVPKYRSVIETNEPPDLSAMNFDKIFTIYSIVKFREYGARTPSIQHVRDSLERTAESVIFRPILRMHILNFKCLGRNSGPQFWRLEFEEP
jgi:hypothetical protein